MAVTVGHLGGDAQGQLPGDLLGVFCHEGHRHVWSCSSRPAACDSVRTVVDHGGEGRFSVQVQRHPPEVETLVAALRLIARVGLPVDPGLDDDRLLGLRGVVARSIDPAIRIDRVKALNDLLVRQLDYFQDDVLADAARIVYGVASGTRHTSLTLRRAKAADVLGYDVDHFRKAVEPKIHRQMAWQLNQDSQNYTPRGREMPVRGEPSGDTPIVSAGDVASLDKALHEEALSRLWAHVYALRAEIIKVERLKKWPRDPTEPEASAAYLAQAVANRDGEIAIIQRLIAEYIDAYGEAITHGDSEYNVHALMRLAGWDGHARH